MKQVDIAFVGDVNSGKTFLFESMARFFFKSYDPLRSNRFTLTNNTGINTEYIPPLHGYWENNRNNSHVTTLDNLIVSVGRHIQRPAGIRTELRRFSIPELYASLIECKGQDNFIITMNNIPGEVFNPFFEPIDAEIAPQITPFTIIRQSHVYHHRSFWMHTGQMLGTENEAWNSFAAEVETLVGESKFGSNDFQQRMEIYRVGFLSFLYCCYCNHLIFCSDDFRKPTQEALSTLKVGQIINFNNTKKHLYHVLTKVDRFLQTDQPHIRSLDDFEKFYYNLTHLFENRVFTQNEIFKQSEVHELNDVLNNTFGGMFYKSIHPEYQDFVISCCLHYDENNGGNFVSFEPDRWNENSNEKRRSIGVRELLSTILYNNGIPIDKLGNLAIGNEDLKKRYYDHNQA